MHGVDVLQLDFNGTQYLHILIEALRLAFADSEYWLRYRSEPPAQYYVTDPKFEFVPVDQLLSKVRLTVPVADLGNRSTFSPEPSSSTSPRLSVSSTATPFIPAIPSTSPRLTRRETRARSLQATMRVGLTRTS